MDRMFGVRPGEARTRAYAVQCLAVWPGSDRPIKSTIIVGTPLTVGRPQGRDYAFSL
jgi:undecaprenyl pyrophosphate phosphatase UppP